MATKRALVLGPVKPGEKKRRCDEPVLYTKFPVTTQQPLDVKQLTLLVQAQAQTIQRQEAALAQMKATLERHQRMLLQAQSLLLQNMTPTHQPCSYIS